MCHTYIHEPDGPARPQLLFVASEEEAAATPQSSALVLSALSKQLGLTEIAEELGMDKHHGVGMDHVILVFLLFATYGATSVRDLERKAKEDTALAAVMDGIGQITQRVLRYFEERHDQNTLASLLDRFLCRAQKHKGFESREDGILALDDTTIQKFGKEMENIAVVYDHCEKRYYLGFVLVSTCYCDAKKSYPVNFEFRVQTAEERRRASEARLKKKAGVDFRRKGAVKKWLQALRDENQMPSTLSMVGSQVSGKNFKQADAFEVPWVAAAHNRLHLHDVDGVNRWEWDCLKAKTLENSPHESEMEGLKLYVTEVSLPDYDRGLDFVVVQDFAGTEVAVLLLPRATPQERMTRILAFFERENDPDASKLHVALRLLRRAKMEAKIKATTAAMDSWYFVVWFMKALLEIPGIHRVVSTLKANQRVCHAGKTMEADQLWDLPGLHFQHERAKGFKWASVRAVIVGLGEVRLVLVQELDKKRPQRVTAKYVVVCTDPDFPPLKVVESYKMRWSIEVFYRTAKQRFGLTQFHSRNFAAICCHVTFVFLAYLMTTFLRLTTPTLMNCSLGEVIDDYLRSLVRIERRGNQLIVVLGPRFVKDFGLPTVPTS